MTGVYERAFRPLLFFLTQYSKLVMTNFRLVILENSNFTKLVITPFYTTQNITLNFCHDDFKLTIANFKTRYNEFKTRYNDLKVAMTTFRHIGVNSKKSI